MNQLCFEESVVNAGVHMARMNSKVLSLYNERPQYLRECFGFTALTFTKQIPLLRKSHLEESHGDSLQHSNFTLIVYKHDTIF